MARSISFTLLQEEGWQVYTVNTEHPEQTSHFAVDRYISSFDWSPDGRHIACHSLYSPVNALYVLDADGSNLHYLSSVSRWIWSPDGKQLAFACQEENALLPLEHPLDAPLSILDLESGAVSKLSEAGELLAWSPDGQQLTFLCTEGRSLATEQLRRVLSVFDRESSVVHRLFTEEAQLAWIPGTSEAAFLWLKSEHEIFRMDAQGAYRRSLFHSEATIEQAVWSPDQHYLAIITGDQYKARSYLHIVNAFGRPVIKTDWPVADGNMLWSPNSRHIACYSQEPEDGRLKIYVVGVDGSAPRRLSESMYLDPEIKMAWSPDGHQLAFLCNVTTADDEGDIYELRVVHTETWHIWYSSVAGSDPTGDITPYAPVWSPDGLQLAYVSTGMEHLYTVAADGAHTRCLTTDIKRQNAEQHRGKLFMIFNLAYHEDAKETPIA